MLTIYPALFYEEKNGTISVIFPDLNHLATCGDSMEEALSMAVDCLAGYIYTEKMEGRSIPKPTKINKIDIHCEDEIAADYKNVFVNMVSVDVQAYAQQHFSKAVKKTLSLPKWLNDMATAKHINFSGILQKALLDELHIEKA